MENILIQLIGGIGLVIWITSVLKKDKSNILIYQGIANLFMALQFFLLGVYTPAALDFTMSVRSFIYRGYTKNDKSIPMVWLFIFSLVVLIIAIVTWNGLLALIPIINTLMYIVTSWMKETKWLRMFFVIAAMLWLYYNFNVGAYVMVVGNIFEISTGIYSLVKFTKKAS